MHLQECLHNATLQGHELFFHRIESRDGIERRDKVCARRKIEINQFTIFKIIEFTNFQIIWY